MSDNLTIWKTLAQPPKEALKEIKGGRLKGMTDIKPQWRYKAMTEQFGICGVGWKYTITKEWTEQGSHEQVLCFVDVDLFIKVDGAWSDAIPGTGGSMLVTKESAGLHTSDEGFKMALTDALSVAMGRIGVAADIYMGNWDGSKYKDAPKGLAKKKESTFSEKMTAAKKAVGDEFYQDCLTAYKCNTVADVKPEDQKEMLNDLRKQRDKIKKSQSQRND